MKTAFFELLENETRPHIILGHIHRRQNEFDCVHAATRTKSFRVLDDHQLLDLLIVSKFAERITCRVGRDDNKVFTTTIAREGVREHRGTYEDLGRTLAYRVISPTHILEYQDIIRDSENALRVAWSKEAA